VVDSPIHGYVVICPSYMQIPINLLNLLTRKQYNGPIGYGLTTRSVIWVSEMRNDWKKSGVSRMV